MRTTNYTTLFLSLLTLAMVSCKDDDPLKEEEIAPSAPATYNFTNVNYNGQTVKLLMLELLETKMNAAATTAYPSGELKKYFDSTNTYFGLYTNLSSKSLKQDFLASNATLKARWLDSIYSWIDTIETRSRSGIAGINPLIRSDSVHLGQAVAKTIMGGLFYDQAVNKYLTNLVSANNSTVTPGKGTDMEHQFDEAFGYFGAARDYNNYTDLEKATASFYKDSDGNGSQDPASEKNFKYYARAAATRDNAGLGTDYTKTLFDAFLLGRFAISNNKFTERDAAIATIRKNWEEIIAATVIHYINDTKADADGSVNKAIHWSEMKFYFTMLSFNPSNKLTTMGVYDSINQLMGNKPKDATDEELSQAAGIISGFYGFSVNQKDNWRKAY